jgi:putative membrane-bound dehydrogenase-like protein
MNRRVVPLPCRLRLLVVAAALALPGCDRMTARSGVDPALVRSDAPRRLEVLVLGHADTAHDARAFAPMLAAAVGKDGINISYAEDGATPLAPFDAVVLFGHAPGLAPEARAALARFVAEGRGLVAVHLRAPPAGADDPVAAILAADAAPHGPGTTDTSVHRIVHGEGRIAWTAEGHGRSEWEDPAFQRRVYEGVLWAVGDDVRAQLQAYAVPPLRYEDPPVPIPNYENRPQPPRLQLPLSPEESIRQWQVPPGFALELFAAEPEIVNPIAMTWDERGRLWVVETLDYPNNIQPDGAGNDVIRILEDSDGDGRADRSTLFAEKLSIPTGIVFAKGGVIVSNAPRFLFLQDTTGDDRADVRREIMTGWSVADTHSGPSNLQYGFDNRIWGSVGDAGFDGVAGGKRMKFEDAIYRFRPDGSDLEIVARFNNNTWALGFSEEFDVFTNTANNEHSVFVAIPDRFFDGVSRLRGRGWVRIDGHYERHAIALTRQVDYFGGFTAAGGHSLYTARSFPREYWNRVAFVHEAIGGLVHRAVLERAGSTFRESDGWNLIASADEWAAPVHAQVGPDGAVWILDWYSFIKQHNPTPPGFETGAGGAYETPLRDRHRGRIYRLVWNGAPAYEPLALSADRPNELIAALRHDNLFWRMTAQRLLVDRGETDVQRALYRIIRDRSVDDIGTNAPAIHAIWTLHGLGALDGSNARAEQVVREALSHPSAGVRRNALMALPRTARAFDDIVRAGALADDDASVRLQALLAIAELPASDSVGRTLFALGRETTLLEDPWLPAALFLAARTHAAGFLAAYADSIGALELARLAGRAARGELDSVVDWSDADLDDADWDTVRVPAHWTTTKLAHFPGVVWFRARFELPASAAGDSATLSLGPISDADVTYVNGVRVGAMDNLPGESRRYPVPPGTLRAGTNVVAVEVTNQRRGGGIYGDADSVYLAGTDFRIALASSWKYRKAAEWVGGRAPDFTAGIPFELQFLRFYDPAGAAATAEGEAGPVGGAPAPDVMVALGTVPGQNRYSESVLTVRAGQRVALAFENGDGMPHNVVILARGSDQQETGRMLNAYVSDASASGRDFIPPRLPVIARSPMVSPRQSETLVFTAPVEPGDYPFVCTVPGHWVTMWGILRVTP